jgi:hypothetical protein
MRPGSQDRETVFGSDRCYGLTQSSQFRACVRNIGVCRGRYFDLRLQKLAADMSAGGFLRSVEKRRRHSTRNQLCFRVDQKIFFLDPECELSTHPSPRLLRFVPRAMFQKIRTRSAPFHLLSGNAGKS